MKHHRDSTLRRASRAAAVLATLAAAASPLAGSALAGDESWQDVALEHARAVHRDTLPEDCTVDESQPATADSEIAYPIRVAGEGGEHDGLLVQFRCMLGAYNEITVFVLADATGAAAVQFPVPEAAIVYADAEQTQVESIAVGGIVEQRTLVNPRYDPERQTLEAYGKWRGLGDAYELTRWALRDGRFEIVYYAVDATYDLEDNPRVLIDEEL